MIARTILALFLLSPATAFAAGCSSSETAMSCPEGAMMDHETGTCVPVVSS
ncbi:hypothetical protein LGQ03_01535 [Loktanella sp. TSTF-M6]|uniref:Chitin binding Peritrophin-A domain-containing protein n=1 Tax=Loktanella gaetbuli TaxID=2881335 RepID=A0ABS8BQB0_9RHOB|nr:hypothetical protein [Loktanella gaetbuli]MCB5197914.1 hypothetical protein [Loktanella gaetbuli]